VCTHTSTHTHARAYQEAPIHPRAYLPTHPPTHKGKRDSDADKRDSDADSSSSSSSSSDDEVGRACLRAHHGPGSPNPPTHEQNTSTYPLPIHPPRPSPLQTLRDEIEIDAQARKMDGIVSLASWVTPPPLIFLCGFAHALSAGYITIPFIFLACKQHTFSHLGLENPPGLWPRRPSIEVLGI